MENKKWLYFAKQADEVNLNGIDDCVTLPAKNLVSISPTANNRVTMYFESVKNNDPLAPMDTVILETIVGDAFEVADAIISYINATVPHNGFVTIADDTVTQDPGDARIDAIYAHPSITAVNSINIADASASYNDYPISGHYGVTATAQPADASTLAVNSHYNFGTGTALTYRIPSAAAGRAGDWISVLYTARINNGVTHTFTTTTDTAYAIGSIIRVTPGSSARTGFIDVSTTGDNVITITGADDGDGGIGTRLFFRNMTGETNGWAVECVVEGEDDNSVATTDTVFS